MLFSIFAYKLVFHDPNFLFKLLRNPNLKSVPTLAGDLEIIFQLGCRMDDKEPSKFPTKEMCQQSDDTYHQSRKSLPALHQDLNCLPYLVAMSELPEDQQREHCSPGLMLVLSVLCKT